MLPNSRFLPYLDGETHTCHPSKFSRSYNCKLAKKSAITDTIVVFISVLHGSTLTCDPVCGMVSVAFEARYEDAWCEFGFHLDSALQACNFAPGKITMIYVSDHHSSLFLL